MSHSADSGAAEGVGQVVHDMEGLQCLCGQGHTVHPVCSVGIVVDGKPVVGGAFSVYCC